MNNLRCKSCGKEDVIISKHSTKLTYKGAYRNLVFLETVCAHCLNETETDVTVKHNDFVIQQFKNDVDKIPTAKEIKELRHLCGFELDQMAYRLGISYKSLYAFEKNKKLPSGPIAVLFKILKNSPAALEYFSSPEFVK